MPEAVSIPPAHSFAWTTVQALGELGGSGSIDEINERVVDLHNLSEEQQSLPHPRGSRSEVEYRLAWARTLAKELGQITNSERGVSALTEAGKSATEATVEQLKKERRLRRSLERKAKRAAGASEDLEADEASGEDESNWKSVLLTALREMKPDAFERLAKRLLREAGFVNVTVTGGTGDKGIDGTGVYRMSLVSFPVYFQCKRYTGSVGSGAVRDFRGAMVGRGDKGLLITTGTFTPDAKAEATRDGAPPVDLIDGDQLTDLLRRYNLGVTSVERTVYDVTVQSEFFASV